MTSQSYTTARLASRGAAVILLGLLCRAGIGSARAGQLDRALLSRGGQVIYYLDDKGYRNVGVLPFEVKKGNRPGSTENSPLALNMTTRLENTLIVSQDASGKTIGVIRNAAGAIRRKKVGAWETSASALSRLFTQEYDLAWGGKKAKADAFLTGRIINKGKSRATTTVVIESFDARSMKEGKLVKEKVCSFDVTTDRALLSDLGFSFALSPTVLRRGVTPRDRDRLAIRQVARRDEDDDDEPQAGQSKAHTPDDIAGFSFELLYDGEKQPITPLRQARQGQRMPLYQAPPAPDGAKIVMVLTRNDDSDRTLGVVLKVNGQSTWQREDVENIRCHKWLYSPQRTGERDEFLGFYMDVSGKNLLPFRSLTAEESDEAASTMGARVGWIDIEVFASGSGEGDQSEQSMQVSTRGGARVARRGTSLKRVQAAIRKANNVRLKPVKLSFKPSLVTRRELIDAEVEPIESEEITTGALPNPESIGSIAIRYWERGRR